MRDAWNTFWRVATQAKFCEEREVYLAKWKKWEKQEFSHCPHYKY